MAKYELKDIYFVSLCLAIFTLPFPMQVNNILIVVCLLLRLILGGWHQPLLAMKKSPEIWLIMAFFACHVVGVANSANKTEAWSIVERRLSLVVFPLLLFHADTIKRNKTLVAVYVTGVTSAVVCCLIAALTAYLQTADSGVWFYHEFSSPIKINAVYLSAYALIALFLLFREKVFPGNKYISPVLAIILVVGVILLSSKMMLFLLLIGGITMLLNNRVNSKQIASGLFVLFCVAVLLFPQIRSRFQKEFVTDFSVVKQEQYRYDTPFTGTSLRLVIWKYTYGIQKDKQAWLFGVGTGDFQQYLNEQYLAHKMYTGNPELHDTGYLGYGPHNQYIETMFSMGIIGLIIFLVLLFLLMKTFIRNHDYSAVWVMVVLMAFMLTESALSTNKGIVLFSFMVSFFYARIHPYLVADTDNDFMIQNK